MYFEENNLIFVHLMASVTCGTKHNCNAFKVQSSHQLSINNNQCHPRNSPMTCQLVLQRKVPVACCCKLSK